MRLYDETLGVMERYFESKRYVRWLAVWGAIGSAVATQHNLLVLVVAESMEAKRAAAFELTHVMFVTAMALGDEL